MTTRIEDPVYSVKRSYRQNFLGSIAIVVLSMVIAYWLYSSSITVTKIFQMIGYICWGTSFGASGWEIQTWSGKSDAEALNKKYDKILTLTGFVAFVISCAID